MFVSNTAGAFFKREVNPEATESVRVEVATQKLTDEPSIAVMYAKGLCCPSCGIGIRKKISKLDFVDQTRFNKGVDLDTKHQLVTIGILETRSYDPQLLTKAIENAGYDPIRVYSLSEGKLHTTELSQNEH